MKIIVEGPQGVGKSTVAALLRDLLTSFGFHVTEGDDSPLPSAREGALNLRQATNTPISIHTRQS